MRKIATELLICISLIIFFLPEKSQALIAPVKKNQDETVLLVSNDNISMTYEKLELYHHPLGIWLATYHATFVNTTAHPINVLTAFPSGFDMRMIDKDLVCDPFQNFRVTSEGNSIKKIQYLVKCINFVQATGIEWTMDDGSGIGFVNVFELNFAPDEVKTIHITFNFIVKKPPVKFDPKNRESWYKESMEWIKQDYQLRPENDFKLPVNLASFWALYPDSIIFECYLAQDWLSIEPEEKRNPENVFRKKYEYTEPFGFYTPPDVELQLLTEEELARMSSTKKWLLQNAFSAKYGKKFSHPLLNLYFSKQPWYNPNPYFQPWYLTDFDLENIKIIMNSNKKN